MRITYRQLVEMMNATFNDEQWDSDVTVEVDECYAAELRFADDNNGTSLDEGHPIIYVSSEIAEEDVSTEQQINTWIQWQNR